MQGSVPMPRQPSSAAVPDISRCLLLIFSVGFLPPEEDVAQGRADHEQHGERTEKEDREQSRTNAEAEDKRGDGIPGKGCRSDDV